MGMIPVTNNTAMPIPVGADMVPAGETRLFHAWQVPEHLKPAAEAAPAEQQEQAPDVVAELSDKPAKDVIAGLEALTDAQLEQLGALEQAKGDKARSTVLSALSEMILKRAEAAKT